MTPNFPIFLLSIHGELAPKTVEAARNVHNQTAGAPQNVAAARSLGDLSHMVYVPIDHPGPDAGHFLILDIWNSMDGLNQFFANKTVQEQAGQIFSKRDPVVWTPAQDMISYHFPTPYGRNDRIIGIVYGKLHSREHGRELHNRLVSGSINKARAAGNLAHDAYYRLSPPGQPESLEFFAVDVWFDGEGMQRHYDDPDFMKGFMEMFAEEPMATVWSHPNGDWVEW